jgi:hypothetical protein
MALSIFKSPVEEPWDRFSTKVNRALESASLELRARYQRHLRLGSPVKISEDQGDMIRVPIEVRGGTRQYAVAYLEVHNLRGQPDERRIEAIARDAALAALPYAQTPPEKPGDVVFRYE